MSKKNSILTACFALLFALTTFSPAQDAKPGGKAPAADAGKLSPRKKQGTKNQIRRLLQNSKLTRAQEIVDGAIADAKKHPSNADLLAFAYWGKSVLEGNERDEDSKEKCLEYFRLAIDNGWKNPYTFQYAALIPESIRKSPEFVAMVEELAAEFEGTQEEEFREQLEEQSANPLDFPVPPAIASNPELAKLVAGKPALYVVTRVFHDGFRKAVATINEIDGEYAETVPTIVLYYQNFADDTHRASLATKYSQKHSLATPYVVVDREFVKPLEITFFPVFFFVDANGRQIFRQDGLIHERFMAKFLRIAMDEIKKTTPAAPPKAPPPPKASKPAEPAVPTLPEGDAIKKAAGEAANGAADDAEKAVDEVKKAVEKKAAETGAEEAGAEVKKAAEKALEKVLKKNAADAEKAPAGESSDQ